MTLPDRLRRISPFTAVVLLGLAVAGAVLAAFFAHGGRLFTVSTPSMGRAAPPGTLVVTYPSTLGELGPGDVITFRAPTSGEETYTHRVVAVTPESATTRGDANGAPDAWPVTQDRLVGRAVALVPAGGYAVQVLPLLLVGTLLVVVMARWWLPWTVQPGAVLLGTTLVLAFVVLRFRPLVNVKALQILTDEEGARFTVVSTGILPVRLAALPQHGTADPLALSYGDLGQVLVHGDARDGVYLLSAALDLTAHQWVLMFVVWLVPIAVASVLAWRTPFPATGPA